MSGRTAAVTVSRRACVPPECVWACLADPYSFARWVSGTARVRSADAGWPAVGARLHHRWGPPFWQVRDHSTVVGSDPPHRLALMAGARPFGVVRADIAVHGDGVGAIIVLREEMIGGWGKRLPLLSRPIQYLRNRRSVRRLADLAERTAAGRLGRVRSDGR